MITIKDDIFKNVLQTILKFNLIKNNDKIIIGISGGADSVFLFLILNELKKKYNLQLLLAHLNHGLRDKDSDNDEKFVKDIANEYNTSIKIKRTDIVEIKKKKKSLSIEEIGHIERYIFFNSLLKKEKFDKIALGHNLDDSIENFFLKSFNGGSLNSLSGIKVSEGNIIRPLINCYKKDIENLLKKKNIPNRFDKSNNNNNFPRNWIRNNLIPYIEHNYKPVKKNIKNLIEILYHENEYIKEVCSPLLNRIKYNNNIYTSYFKYDSSVLKRTAILRRITHDIFIKLNIPLNHSEINKITDFIKKSEKSSIKIKNYLIWKYKKYIIFTKQSLLNEYNYTIKKLPYEINIENLKLYITIREINKDDFIIDRNCLFFDKDKVNKIIIRQKKIGDYIHLMNTDFRTKLKDYFIDSKIPVPLKSNIPIIENKGEVIGLFLNLFPLNLKNKISDKYKVTDKTKKIIKMGFKQTL